MPRPESPCHYCMNRRVDFNKTCHSSCADYLEYKAELIECIRKEKKQTEASNLDMFHSLRNTKTRWYK